MKDSGKQKDLQFTPKTIIILLIICIIGFTCGYLLWRDIKFPSFFSIFIGVITFLVGVLLPDSIIRTVRRKSIFYLIIFFLSIIIGSFTSLWIIPPQKEGLSKYLSKKFKYIKIVITDTTIDTKLMYIEIIGQEIDTDYPIILEDNIDLKYHNSFIYFYSIKKHDEKLFNRLNWLQVRLLQKPSMEKPLVEIPKCVGTIWIINNEEKSRDIEFLKSGDGYQLNLGVLK